MTKGGKISIRVQRKIHEKKVPGDFSYRTRLTVVLENQEEKDRIFLTARLVGLSASEYVRRAIRLYENQSGISSLNSSINSR